jgi:hypothetical protein
VLLSHGLLPKQFYPHKDLFDFSLPSGWLQKRSNLTKVDKLFFKSEYFFYRLQSRKDGGIPMFRVFLMTVVLISSSAHAAECKNAVTDFLKSNGYGTYDQPGVNKLPQDDRAVVFGDYEKNGFKLTYWKSDNGVPKLITETKNALGTAETQITRFDSNCNITEINRNSEYGQMDVTAEFCNKFEARKGKMTAADMTNPSKDMISGSKFDQCYKPVQGVSICEKYKGQFAKTRRVKTEKDAGEAVRH